MDYFDDQPDLYGEPPLYADALALPIPPPPEPVGIGPPVAPAPFDAAQYLPPPPPPDAGIAAFPLGEQDALVSAGPAELPPSFAPPPPIATLPSLAAPPPLVPDAVSSARGMPASGEIAGQSYAPTLTPMQRDVAMLQQYADDPLAIPDDDLRQRYLNDLALRNRPAFEDLMLQHEDARQKEGAARRQKIANDNYEQQRANQRAVAESRAKIQQQTDQVMAEAQRLYDEKIDPTGGLSAGQKIAGVLSSIVGGLVQGRTGAARNAGLDSFNDLVNRGIEAQKATLANRRNMLEFKRSALGQAYERTGDMFVAAEAVRQSAYTHAVGMLDADMQNWDPRGTQAMRRAQLRAKILTEQAQSLHKFQNEQEDRDLKQREQRRKEEETRAQIANQKAQIGLGYARINEDREQRKATDKARLADKAQERADKEAERSRQFSIGGIPRVKLGADGKPVIGQDGKPVVVQDKLRQSDGAEFQAASPEERKTLREKKTAGFNAMRNIDRILAIRDRVGGESSLFNSDEKQELDGLEADTTAQIKSGTQGMSSDSDMDIIKKSAGVDNTTSWRDQRAKLIAARARIEANLNQAYGDSGYDGERITVPVGSLGKTEDTPDEIKNQRLFQKPTMSFQDAARRDLADRQIAAGRENGLDVNNPDDQRIIAEALAATQADWDPGADPSQQRRIRALGIEARGGDVAAEAARALLGQLAETAQTAKLRSLAQAALEEANRAGLGEQERTTTSTDTGMRAAPAPGRSELVTVPPELTLGGR